MALFYVFDAAKVELANTTFSSAFNSAMMEQRLDRNGAALRVPYKKQCQWHATIHLFGLSQHGYSAAAVGKQRCGTASLEAVEPRAVDVGESKRRQWRRKQR